MKSPKVSTRVAAGLALALVAGAFGAVRAQEKVTLTTPVFSSAGATDFRVASIYLHRDHPDGAAEIRIIFREVDATGFVPLGRELACRYAGADAETAIRGLNTANLTVSSLERRVTARCQQDGKLGAGTISGTPQ